MKLPGLCARPYAMRIQFNPWHRQDRYRLLVVTARVFDTIRIWIYHAEVASNESIQMLPLLLAEAFLFPSA